MICYGKKNLRVKTQNSRHDFFCLCSLAGSTEREDTKKLDKQEKKKRAEAYKGLTPNARKEKKVLFDANMTPRVTRCNTVRILPTPVQHAWLMRWFKDGRQTYNLAMAHVLKERLHKT
jgi:hypothetical protein